MAESDAFYNELLADVNETLEEFGTEYTVRSPGVYDGTELESTPSTNRKVTGLVSTGNEMHILAGESGWVSTKTLLLTAGAAPKAGEEVQVDGKWFPLSKLTAIKPADVVVLYMLDVAR